MSVRSLTYRVFSLLEAPKISPELLWDLVWLFAGLGGVYLLLIFNHIIVWFVPLRISIVFITFDGAVLI